MVKTFATTKAYDRLCDEFIYRTLIAVAFTVFFDSLGLNYPERFHNPTNNMIVNFLILYFIMNIIETFYIARARWKNNLSVGIIDITLIALAVIFKPISILLIDYYYYKAQYLFVIQNSDGEDIDSLPEDCFLQIYQ